MSIARTTPRRLVNEKDGYELVLVPGGEFMMGSEDGDKDASPHEKPRHLHRLEPYYIGIYCVTVGQFKKFVEATGHNAGSDWQADPANHPVRAVNWHDASAYAQWSGLRLPTEAEWELSARGYEGRKYPWGEEWEEGRRVCWGEQRGPGGDTVPVDAHPEGVGPFGTYQQAGNVWEWCEDWYDARAYSRYAQRDFRPPQSGGARVLRGASWFSSFPGDFRGSSRSNFDPALRSFSRGFRLARTL